MFLGIEIGGTKLQLGVGAGDGPPLVAFKRLEVDRASGAAGIREQIRRVAGTLIELHLVSAIGIGFGGPVDSAAGRTIKSHQIDGWEDFPLADWCRQTFALPTVMSNDSDSAGLAEARFGAGCGRKVVFYANAGSGVGGALVLDGEVYRGSSGVASELGHLRPGPQAQRPDQTVESHASGWGIAAAAQARLAEPRQCDAQFAADLRQRCDGQIERLSTKMLAEAAAEGNLLAQEILCHAVQVFGWAVAQMITLVAPEVVVIGGGVPQMGQSQFFAPLRHEVDRYVFPPLRGTYQIVPAALGEEVVVHGALALASTAGSGQ